MARPFDNEIKHLLGIHSCRESAPRQGSSLGLRHRYGGTGTGVSGRGETISTGMACPLCGASGQRPGQRCQSCGRNIIRMPAWAQPEPRQKWTLATILHPRWLPMTRTRWIVLSVVVLICAIYFWRNYQVIPNPITLAFKGPSSSITSSVGPGQWSMAGGNFQQTRYVADAPRLPEGRPLWSRDVGADSVLAVPAVADGVLYVGGYFKMMALKAETGEQLWEIRAPGPVHSTLAVAGDRVYAGLTDTRVVALDRHTGQELWGFDTDGYIVASSIVSNGILFIGSSDKRMYALDAATGKLIWRFRTDDRINAAPSLQNGVLYFTSDDDSLYSVNYRTGQSRMRFRTRDIKTGAAPVAANGLVYMVSDGGILTAKAGIREVPARWNIQRTWAFLWVHGFPVTRPPAQQGTKWRFTPKDRAGIGSSPAVTPEAIYVGTIGGIFYARHAKSGSAVWEFKADGAIRGSPVVVGPAVYFGTEKGTLYALARADGAVLWQTSLDAPINLALSFADGRLYVRTDDGWLHVIQ